MTQRQLVCTCWRLPSVFGEPQPLGWLMLHEAVTIRLRTLTGQGAGFTGQILTALWGGSPGDRQRYLLVMADRD